MALREPAMRFPSARGAGRLMAVGPRGDSRASEAELEPAQALERLLAHLQALHPGQPGPFPAEADHGLDRLGIALEGRLHAAVGPVAHPAGHAVRLGARAGGGAEADALYAPADHHPAADGLGRHSLEAA